MERCAAPPRAPDFVCHSFCTHRIASSPDAPQKPDFSLTAQAPGKIVATLRCATASGRDVSAYGRRLHRDKSRTSPCKGKKQKIFIVRRLAENRSTKRRVASLQTPYFEVKVSKPFFSVSPLTTTLTRQSGDPEIVRINSVMCNYFRDYIIHFKNNGASPGPR